MGVLLVRQIGKLIVLESGEGPPLPIDGELFCTSTARTTVNRWVILNPTARSWTEGETDRPCQIDLEVVTEDGKPFWDPDTTPGQWIVVRTAEDSARIRHEQQCPP